MKHVCSACLSTLDTFEKDEDTVVVMPCEYCRMQEVNLARLCNEKLANMMARHNVDVVKMTLKAAGVKL